MPDCPPNNSDCLPAGSNATDPCSPCFEPTAQNFLSVQAELARQVCALGNQIKGWNQRLDKFRNRMDRLEDEIDSLPDPEDALVANPCANSNAVEEADAIVVCEGGTESIFTAGEDDESFEIVSCGGKWKKQAKGGTYHRIETPVQLLNSVVVGSYPVTLPDFPDDVCGPVIAKFKVIVSAGDGPSGSAHQTTLYVGSIATNNAIALSGFHDSLDLCYPDFPFDSSSTTFVFVNSFGSGGGGANVWLLGYYY